MAGYLGLLELGEALFSKMEILSLMPFRGAGDVMVVANGVVAGGVNFHLFSSRRLPLGHDFTKL